jgi:hypothetical protein
MITWAAVERYADPIKTGAFVGLITGIAGPLMQYKSNLDNPETPDVDESGIAWMNEGKTVHSWIVGYGLALVATMIGFGFGALGVEWIVMILAAAVAHLFVAYVSSFVIPIFATKAGE